MTELPAAPEAALTAAVLARLPRPSAPPPPPPWPCRVEAVVWWHRCPATARGALAGLLPPARRPGGPRLVVAAAVRYLDSPVGPYEEVLAGVVVAPLVVHLPFLAVDSALSLHGGREHWALPKTLATVQRTGADVVARGDGWRVAVQPAPRGPRLPAAGLLVGRQPGPDGRPVRSRSAFRGRVGLATATVTVGTDLAGEPGSLAGWLRSGRHAAAVLAGHLRVSR